MERHVIYSMKTASIGSMRQLDLDDRSVWMDESKVVALFSAVGGRTGKDDASIPALKIDWWKMVVATLERPSNQFVPHT